MIRARFLIPVMLAAAIGSFAIVFLIWPDVPTANSRNPWPMSAGLLLQSASIFGVTVWRARRAGLAVGDLFSPLPVPVPARAVRLLLLGVSTVGLGFVTLYLVFAPLSLLLPDATQSWLFKEIPVMYSPGPPYPFFGNLVGLVAAIVAAPVAEEWLFRGLLLLRWREKWGPLSAVMASSAVFALLHDNIPGAFVFGVVMCALCLQYRSLWAPTIVHASNNALACVIEVTGAHGWLPVQLDDVSQLRAMWWLPVVGSVLALPLMLRIRTGFRTITSWQFGPRLSSATPPADPFLPTN